MPETATSQVPRAVRPLVWLLAALWLPLRVAGSATGRGLEAYDRGTDAVGRAVARAARAVGRGLLRLVRLLGPLGRALRAAVAPVLRVLRRAWDRLGLWVLLRLLRPVGRFFRRLLTRAQPLIERATAVLRAVTARLEPVERALGVVVVALDGATDRAVQRLRRAFAPVGHAVAVLARALGARDRGASR